MKYELAKQLKDAGFKQPNFKQQPFSLSLQGFKGSLDYTVMDNPVYAPTLEELIEECPKSYNDDGIFFYFTLRKSGEHWVASYQSQSLESGRGFSLGETPEEVVAKLWLELKKEKKQ